MKPIRILFFIILILSNIKVLRGDYSSNTFIEYLQLNGYYDTIEVVKSYFGNDVAIDLCQSLVQSSDCEIVVRVYMTSQNGGGGGNGNMAPPLIDTETYEQIIEYFEIKYNIKEGKRKLINIILSYCYLIENMNKEEIINFIERIISNPQILNSL